MMERMAKQLIAKVAQSYSNKPLEVCLGNNSPILTLTCQECGLVKKSAEEMEVHIKVEHINWLPFKCPHCKTHRASDAMMREHIHAAHKQSAKEYIYVDNLEAKRKLQNLLDQSLYATVSKKIGFVEENYESAMSPEASTAAHSTTSSDSPPGEPSSPRVPFEIDGATAKVEIRTGGNANTDAILASITQAATGGHSQEIHEEETDPLIALLKSYQRDKTEVEIEGELKEDHNQSFDLAGNLSIIDSLFGKGGLSESSFSDSPNRKNVTTQLSKKKLVGYCKGCTKPVTAGARQMHLFYHLAKDYLIFRFFCKFDGCTIEHYRKDQMEHHMTKVHGQVIPELIGDRTDELYHKSKELQQELLGEMPTTNSGSSDPPSTPLLKRPAPQPATHPPDDKQTLQCNICKKYMENRVKGFHILHHLAKDNGILRYTCKLCDFAHDRSQSVLGHGKKEHGREDVVLDRIADYEDEVQEMSQKCFGFDTNFETSKKKARGSVYISKMPKGDVDENTSENDDQPEAVGSPEHNQELEDEAEEME